MMNPIQMAALERLIASSSSHPMLRLLAMTRGADIGEYVTQARHIATLGMSLEEAQAFREATDTEAERTLIGQIMAAVHPDLTDDRLVLDWAWAEAARVLATLPPPIVPPVLPGGSARKEYATGRPLLIISGPTYHMLELPETQIAARVLLIASNPGVDGLDCEIGGRANKPGEPERDIVAHTMAQIEKLAKWMPHLRAAKLWLLPKIFNTNADGWKKRPSQSSVIAALDLFKTRIGFEGVLPLICSENDSDMDASVVAACRKWGRTMANVPPSNLVEYDRDVDSQGFTETHLSSLRTKDSPLGWRYLNVPDNGITLGMLDGSGWKDHAQPDIGKRVNMALACHAAGVSWEDYCFEPEYDHARATALSNAVLKARGTASATDDPRIDWKLLGWEVTTDLRAVTLGGGLIRYNVDLSTFKDFGDNVCANNWIGIPDGRGKFKMTSFEFMRRTNPTREMSTVEPGHLETNWRPVSGETYPFALSNGGRHNKNMLGRRSTIAWAKWP